MDAANVITSKASERPKNPRGDSNHPTAPTQIGHEHYTCDANGNPTQVENDSLNNERENVLGR